MKQEMHYNTFDTHKYIKALVAQGMKEAQAETIVTTILESRDVDLSKFVTKDQFTKLQHEVDLIKQEIRYIKENMVTKAEFAEFRSDVKTEIAEIRSEIKTEIAEIRSEIASVKFDILKWIIPFLIGIIIAIFAK
jgi:predicted  nucleic acid-binding Zn-ribbon protein